MTKHDTVSRGTVCFLTLLMGVKVLASGNVAQRKLTLANDGRTSYVITLGDDASAPEREVAEDLASYLGGPQVHRRPIMISISSTHSLDADSQNDQRTLDHALHNVLWKSVTIEYKPPPLPISWACRRNDP